MKFHKREDIIDATNTLTKENRWSCLFFMDMSHFKQQQKLTLILDHTILYNKYTNTNIRTLSEYKY